MDGVWTNHCTYSRNYFHNTYSGGFFKGGGMYNVFDSNVFVSPVQRTVLLGIPARRLHAAVRPPIRTTTTSPATR